jgi:hypothetical protein
MRLAAVTPSFPTGAGLPKVLPPSVEVYRTATTGIRWQQIC